MIACVPRINRYQRQIAQISAILRTSRCGTVCLRNHRIREVVGNAMLMDRDQANRTRLGWITKAGHNTCLGQPHPAFGARLFRLNQLSVFGAIRDARGNCPFLL